MKDIMRCLKRAIAREIYQELTRPTGFAITPENPALNAFAITFNGRITPTGNQPMPRSDPPLIGQPQTSPCLGEVLFGDAASGCPAAR